MVGTLTTYPELCVGYVCERILTGPEFHVCTKYYEWRSYGNSEHLFFINFEKLYSCNYAS